MPGLEIKEALQQKSKRMRGYPPVARDNLLMFPIPGNPEGNKKAEKKTPDDKVRFLFPAGTPVLSPTQV